MLSREEGDPDSHREGSHPPGDDALQAAGLHQVHERRRVSERNTCLCFTSDAYYSWWKCGVVCGSLMKREPLGGCAVSRRDLSRFRGGENIFSAEVENALSQHPDIAVTAVIGIPSDQWGESVHAVLIPKEGAKLDQTEVIAFCKERIAGFKCPRSIEIVAEMPMSGAGKILKTELRKPHWEGQGKSVS